MSLQISPMETSTDIYVQVAQFLALEAALLDDNRVWDWYKLLADDYQLDVPIRIARKRGAGDEFVAGSHHMKDTKGSTEKRILRLFSGHAWAEDPPSRTCRVVGSVVILGERLPGEFEVSSSLILYRERGLTPAHTIIAGKRSDIIRVTENGLELVARTMHLAHTILNTSNLGVFI